MPRSSRSPVPHSWLRIVGGTLRGRKVYYTGSGELRPMKDRTREAVFNLIWGLTEARTALDLFAGTGALGLEAISRGASRAVLVEQNRGHRLALEGNVARLELQDKCTVLAGDAFRRHWIPDVRDVAPWLLFCSAPYRLYDERHDEFNDLFRWLIGHAPARSTLVVEVPANFDIARLPHPERWDIRSYPPALIAILAETLPD